MVIEFWHSDWVVTCATGIVMHRLGESGSFYEWMTQFYNSESFMTHMSTMVDPSSRVDDQVGRSGRRKRFIYTSSRSLRQRYTEHHRRVKDVFMAVSSCQPSSEI